MSRQDIETRRKRLAQGNCPLHGIGLTQTDDRFVLESGLTFVIFRCPRFDCDFTARAHPGRHYWAVTPETAPLLGERASPEAVYNYDDLIRPFGRINLKLAIRAHKHMALTGDSASKLLEAALASYLDQSEKEPNPL